MDLMDRLRAAVATAAGVPLDAVGEPQQWASQGDLGWFLVPVDDGRWAAITEYEEEPPKADHAVVFASRQAAEAYLQAAWEWSTQK